MQGEVPLDPSKHQQPVDGCCCRTGCSEKAVCQPHARIYRTQLDKVRRNKDASIALSFNMPMCKAHIAELSKNVTLLFTPEVKADVAKGFYARNMEPPDMRTIEVFGGPIMDTNDEKNSTMIGTRLQ